MSRPIENVPLTKIYVPALCNGSISITPNITLIDESYKDENSKSETVEFSYTYAGEDGDDGIIIEGDELYEIDIDMDCTDGTNLNYLKYVPAFYSNGTINIDSVIKETDDPDSKVDLVYDVLMYVKAIDKPSWYPYDLDLRDAVLEDDWYSEDPDKKGMAYVMEGMINSPNKEVEYNTIGDNTNVPLAFSINSWVGFRPLWTDLPPHKPTVRMGLLPPLSFKVYIKNKLADSVTLSQITISFKFNYDTKAVLMNLGSPSASDFCQLYCGPNKMAGDAGENEDVTGDPRHLWAIVDGYEGGTDTDQEEIVKVYGYFDKWNATKGYSERQTVVLEPVTSTGGSNFPPVVYKSKEAVIPRFDNDRMVYRGFRSGEVAWVVTQKEMCQGSKFKDVIVKCVKPSVDEETEEISGYSRCPTNDPDAEFHIWIKLRDDVEEVTCDDGMTIEELEGAIKTVRFFDEDIAFASTTGEGTTDPPSNIVFKRLDINKLFYDTLYDTFEESVVLVSMRDDVEPYVEIKINSNQIEEQLDWIPLYHGKPLKFNESLSKCTDGIRSREIWFYGDKNDSAAIPNVIELNPDIPYQYRVSFSISAMEYKDMHVHVDVEEDEDE